MLFAKRSATQVMFQMVFVSRYLDIFTWRTWTVPLSGAVSQVGDHAVRAVGWSAGCCEHVPLRKHQGLYLLFFKAASGPQLTVWNVMNTVVNSNLQIAFNAITAGAPEPHWESSSPAVGWAEAFMLWLFHKLHHSYEASADSPSPEPSQLEIWRESFCISLKDIKRVEECKCRVFLKMLFLIIFLIIFYRQNMVFLFRVRNLRSADWPAGPIVMHDVVKHMDYLITCPYLSRFKLRNPRFVRDWPWLACD